MLWNPEVEFFSCGWISFISPVSCAVSIFLPLWNHWSQCCVLNWDTTTLWQWQISATTIRVFVLRGSALKCIYSRKLFLFIWIIWSFIVQSGSALKCIDSRKLLLFIWIIWLLISVNTIIIQKHANIHESKIVEAPCFSWKFIRIHSTLTNTHYHCHTLSDRKTLVSYGNSRACKTFLLPAVVRVIRFCRGVAKYLPSILSQH
jgi:hypothetical protein